MTSHSPKEPMTAEIFIHKMFADPTFQEILHTMLEQSHIKTYDLGKAHGRKETLAWVRIELKRCIENNKYFNREWKIDLADLERFVRELEE